MDVGVFPSFCGGRVARGRAREQVGAPARSCARLACTGPVVVVRLLGTGCRVPGACDGLAGRQASHKYPRRKTPAQENTREHRQVRRDAMRGVDVLCF